VGPLPRYLDAFAPLSGEAWESARAEMPSTVESPAGEATVRYDEYGVPTIEAANDAALYFATGYVHAADRLFQMDLFRRRMRGTLSEAVGERGLADDEFHTRMDFAAAAEANWQLLEGTDAGNALSAYADGVNAYRRDNPLPFEFELLGYEPGAWSPVASMLIEKQISWGLTGDFETLRRETVAEQWDQSVADELYPRRMDHDVPILQPSASFAALRRSTTPRTEVSDPATSDGFSTRRETSAPTAATVNWLSRFEAPAGTGSNSWIVSGEHTDSGQPLLANDPHLTLLAPPVWYEMHQRTDDLAVSGVAFPGVPFVVIGENETGAWGFTNANADVIDFYEYEIDGDQYRYGAEWRDFETETRTIAVADGEDREITVRKTVHGPLIERNGDRFGVAWTGFMGSRTSQAVYDLNRSATLADARAAFEQFDQPTQCGVYANRNGETYFAVTGLIPRRTTDGEPVEGDQIFDGSAKAGEWEGYEPYGRPDFADGNWIPFAEKPQAENPEYLATANQRIVDDEHLSYYLAESYAPPFRAQRITDVLEHRANSSEAFTQAFMRDVQRDVVDRRARLFVPTILDARSEMDEPTRELATVLADWNGEMNRDSRAALIFERFLEHYRAVVFGAALETAGLDDSFVPNDWVLLTLSADSEWFDADPGPTKATRAAAIDAAMQRTADELDDNEWETYGDYNVTSLAHPFDQGFLNYPLLPTDGSPGTVRNYRKGSGAGSSYRLLARFDGEPSLSILPGGNDGDPFSDHYQDQLRAWADGEYTTLTATTEGEPRVRFEVGDST